jgi:DNA-directed RNA polymerase subunit M/transcription elongation factor TFIIS
MSFCDNCEHLMNREILSGQIIFVCGSCGTSAIGKKHQLLINSGNPPQNETKDKFKNIIKFAPEDPVNQVIRQECDNCGRDYMIQLRLGDIEAIIKICKCKKIHS